jgi:hypothetical protein
MKHIVDEINDAYVTLHKRKKKNKKMISNGNWVIDMQRGETNKAMVMTMKLSSSNNEN